MSCWSLLTVETNEASIKSSLTWPLSKVYRMCATPKGAGQVRLGVRLAQGIVMFCYQGRRYYKACQLLISFKDKTEAPIQSPLVILIHKHRALLPCYDPFKHPTIKVTKASPYLCTTPLPESLSEMKQGPRTWGPLDRSHLSCWHTHTQVLTLESTTTESKKWLPRDDRSAQGLVPGTPLVWFRTLKPSVPQFPSMWGG